MDNYYDLDSDELNANKIPSPTIGSNWAMEIMLEAYESYKATHPSYKLDPID